MLPSLCNTIGALALAVGIWGRPLNVRYRDVGTVLRSCFRLDVVSPTRYSSSLVPQKARLLYSLNPLVGIIGGFGRHCSTCRLIGRALLSPP